MQPRDDAHTGTLLAGCAAPLGAHCVNTPDGSGVNFALWSSAATRVELCVFDAGAERRYSLPTQTHGVWHGFLPGAVAGLLYGYRVYGPYDPANGQRFDPTKLLIDPYARRILGEVKQDDRLLDSVAAVRGRAGSRDSAPVMPRCVVVDDQFDWGDTQAPTTTLSDTVVYELHVKGYTRLHPQVPEAVRGTYLGLAEPVIIDHLKQLGVTAVELLPCASFVSESSLTQRGLSNYWGYNPMAYFSPHAAYACQNPVTEFQTMVRAMHDAGIEVIVDVVYNHTAEGNEQGPTLSFRGIDNAAYYHLKHHDRSSYINNSGCGNSLAVDHPAVLRMVLDSLRYWVDVLHVDGFRFDLGPSLARVHGEFDSNAAFFQAIGQDPVLSQVKLFTEPWDVGHAGYRLGQFPPGWSEWNDRYRSTVRSFWRGDNGQLAELASRLSGSSDIFGQRGSTASINYITAHDGFTLTDLVSYEQRHNDANGENNNDGDGHNLSWNHGVEGPASDREIQFRRNRDKRALLATLVFSQGVPMILGGDELGRTQRGNNNAYCQDNETSWVDWQNTDQSLVDFVAKLTGIRRDQAVFRRVEHLQGALDGAGSLHDVEWLTPSGLPMQRSQWGETDRQVLAVFLRRNDNATIANGDDVLVLINASAKAVEFSVPDDNGSWRAVLDSARFPAVWPASETDQKTGGMTYLAAAHSLVLLLGNAISRRPV